MVAASLRLMGINGFVRMFSGFCECSCGMIYLMLGKVVNISEFVDGFYYRFVFLWGFLGRFEDGFLWRVWIYFLFCMVFYYFFFLCFVRRF